VFRWADGPKGASREAIRGGDCEEEGDPVRSRAVFPIRATGYWCIFFGRRPPTSGECDVAEVPVWVVYVSSPVVVVRVSSVAERRVVLPEAEDVMVGLRFASATAVTAGGVGVEARRSSLD